MPGTVDGDYRVYAEGEQPRILLHTDGSAADGYAAVVELQGAHDLGTAEAVRVALAPLYGRVLVDLTSCSFVDSTIITVLVRKSQSLGRDGQKLEIDPPADGSAVARTLELVSLRHILPYRAGQGSAIKEAVSRLEKAHDSSAEPAPGR